MSTEILEQTCSLLKIIRDKSVPSLKRVLLPAAFAQIVLPDPNRIYLKFLHEGPMECNLAIQPASGNFIQLLGGGAVSRTEIEFTIDTSPALCQAAWYAFSGGFATTVVIENFFVG